MSSITTEELLVSGLSKPKVIPADIINMIISYCLSSGYGINSFLLLYPSDEHCRNIDLVNITTEKHHNINESSLEASVSKYIINNVKLPLSFTKRINDNTDYLDNCCMMTRIGAACGSSNDYRQYDDVNLTIFNLKKNNINMYNFELPSFPKLISNACLAYDTNKNIMYSFIAESGNHWPLTTIYSMNFDDENELKWNIFCKTANFMYSSTESICMIDEGRFIGIMRENHFHLLSLNIKTSIRLKDMNKMRENESSIYNPIYHQILIGGQYSFEQYDINKNVWNVFYERNQSFEYGQKLWLSHSNPNIMFFCGTNGKTECIVEMFDLRTIQKKIHKTNYDIFETRLNYGNYTIPVFL